MANEIVTKDPSPELSQEVSTVVQRAQEVAVIKTDDDLMFAAEFQKQIKGTIKKVEEYFEGDIKTAHDLHKSLVAKKKTLTDPLEKAARITSGSISNFQWDKMEAARRENEARQLKAEKAGQEPPPPAQEPAKIAGIGISETWRAQVIDLEALVKAVAAKKIPAIAILPNEKFLNEQARSLKEQFNFPGCKSVRELGTRTRI
jgi:hypothetical protein